MEDEFKGFRIEIVKGVKGYLVLNVSLRGVMINLFSWIQIYAGVGNGCFLFTLSYGFLGIAIAKDSIKLRILGMDIHIPFMDKLFGKEECIVIPIEDSIGFATGRGYYRVVKARQIFKRPRAWWNEADNLGYKIVASPLQCDIDFVATENPYDVIDAVEKAHQFYMKMREELEGMGFRPKIE